MIEDILSAARAGLPLHVSEVDYADPVVTLIGPSWSLALVCPWQMVVDGSVAFAWDDAAVGDKVWDLVGKRIQRIERRTADNNEDPVFIFDDQSRLEVLADTDLDPWSLQLPSIVIVGRADPAALR